MIIFEVLKEDKIDRLAILSTLLILVLEKELNDNPLDDSIKELISEVNYEPGLDLIETLGMISKVETFSKHTDHSIVETYLTFNKNRDYILLETWAKVNKFYKEIY